MPVKPKANETEQEFISRCMSEEKDSFPETDQRYAVCKSKWDKENMATEDITDNLDNLEIATEQGFADYPWDECISDQIKQYGDEETAKKVCGAIKAANMAAQSFRDLPTSDCMEKMKSAGYTEEYAKQSCSKPKENDAQQGGVVAMNEEFGRKKFEYSPNSKETLNEFMGRCMGDTMVREKKKDRGVRAGFCYSQYQQRYIASLAKGWK